MEYAQVVCTRNQMRDTLVGRRIERVFVDDLPAPLKALMENQVFWMHDRAPVLWNEEVAKWGLLFQK